MVVDKGFERGVWFEVESGGFGGILVNNKDLEKVYMKTKSANESYFKLTKHNRQPVEL